MPSDAAAPGFGLAMRPGFLIRRLHQIHVALFIAECAGFDVTPVQYSILTAVQAHPGLDQATLGARVGVDRATLANVVSRLEARKLVRRRASPSDKRLRLVMPTAKTARLLADMEQAARRAHERTIAALPPKERHSFVSALGRLVEAGNGHGRAALRIK